MRVLEGLTPQKVFYYFEELTRIPHGSGNTTAISNYCVQFAKERGLEYYQDTHENVIIIKPATAGYEESKSVIIQGHLDMVNEKLPDSNHDFDKDALKLMIEGDWITADGTTLGGDDGIAIAYALAILDSDDLEHPRLECVFTTDEEVGLTGANNLDCSNLKAEYLINIDSEDEGIFLSSCAGGMRYNITLPVKRVSQEGLLVEFKLKNLTGGHSGCEIHKERANAVILMGRALADLAKKVDYKLVGLSGGLKDNAIPRECSVQIIINKDELDRLEAAVKEAFSVYKEEYALSEPDMDWEINSLGVEAVKAFSKESFDKVLIFLNFVPNGIQHMSLDIEGLVETSLNLGIAASKDDSISFSFALRSSVASRKQRLGDRLQMFTNYLGGTFEFSGEYPAWSYKRDSRLRELMCDAYKDLFGIDAKVEAIHAGLECGILSEKMPNVDMVSIGPDMRDIHTTEEMLSISSTQRVWQFIVEVLRRLK